MREFTNNEKKFLNEIVAFHNSGELVELQVAKLLRKHVNFFAVSWTLSPKNMVTIYEPREEGIDKRAIIQNNYFEIVNYLLLLKELEDSHLAAFTTISTDSEKGTTKCLYNREEYDFSDDTYGFWKKIDNNGSQAMIPTIKNVYYLSVAQLLDEYAHKIIYPLPLLKEFTNNNFQTAEQVYNKKQLCLSRIMVILALFTLIASIVTMIFSIKKF